MTLVYKLPGPKINTSAFKIDSTAPLVAGASSGHIIIFLIRFLASGILDSPETIVPSVISACN